MIRTGLSIDHGFPSRLLIIRTFLRPIRNVRGEKSHVCRHFRTVLAWNEERMGQL
jgi:hypothetical protein